MKDFFHSMLDEAVISTALTRKQGLQDPWTAYSAIAIKLPVKVEALKPTRWGRIWQRIRIALGHAHRLQNQILDPRRLGPDAQEIFVSVCDPATYNRDHTKATETIVHYRRPSTHEYNCTVRARHGKQTIARVQLHLSLSDGEATIKVRAPAALLARIIGRGTASPYPYGPQYE